VYQYRWAASERDNKLVAVRHRSRHSSTSTWVGWCSWSPTPSIFLFALFCLLPLSLPGILLLKNIWFRWSPPPSPQWEFLIFSCSTSCSTCVRGQWAHWLSSPPPLSSLTWRAYRQRKQADHLSISPPPIYSMIWLLPQDTRWTTQVTALILVVVPSQHLSATLLPILWIICATSSSILLSLSPCYSCTSFLEGSKVFHDRQSRTLSINR